VRGNDQRPRKRVCSIHSYHIYVHCLRHLHQIHRRRVRGVAILAAITDRAVHWLLLLGDNEFWREHRPETGIVDLAACTSIRVWVEHRLTHLCQTSAADLGARHTRGGVLCVS